MFERWYECLGSSYPRAALLFALSGGFATGLLATAGTALYVDMSLSEFARLVLAVWIVFWLPEFLVATWVARRQIATISSWIGGERDAEATARAWRATADLPSAILRNPLIYLSAAPGMLLWGVYATSLLDLKDSAVLIFFGASVLVYLYWAAVRFLGLEMHLRPVLEEIGGALAPEIRIEPMQIALRWRLLASLVAVILITGIAVGGFATRADEQIDGLWHALLGSAVAVVLVASWLIGLLSASITRPVSRLRDAAQKIGRGDLSVRVPLTSTDESAELTQAFNEMVAGLAQREQLREAFGTFVDPDLTERVLDEGTDLAGEEVDLSVLFMDIRGFTTYSESAEPRDVVARLNDLYGEVVPVILKHGGHANKFIGDGLLAIFGAPNRLEDHADRAVAAGQEIAQLVRERYEGELRVGIGINSGTVVVGTIGGGGRLDFTVIGDTVNTASRVESATRETDDDVLITAETKSRLSANDRGWQERPAIPLKGKSEEIALFAPSDT